MRNALAAIIFLLIFATHTLATNYYASTAGTGSTCSIGTPCSLATALGLTTTGADTVFLRGGTYVGRFQSSLAGGTVKSFPGEWAKIDGNLSTTLNGGINSSVTTVTVASTAGITTGNIIRIDNEIMQASVTNGTTLSVVRAWDATTAASHSNGATVTVGAAAVLIVSGGSTTYRDFEVFNSDTARNAGSDSLISLTHGDGISVTGSVDGTNLINLIIHDNNDGLFIGSSTSNTMVYGCLIYNNGLLLDGSISGIWGQGHGLYTENSAGYSRIYNNIFLNNFHFSAQLYGVSGPYVGGDFQNNILANAGSPQGAVTDTDLRNFNLLAGPNAVQSATFSCTNNYFFQPQTADGGDVAHVGYGAGIASLTFTGNYVIGGPTGLRIETVTAATITGNKFYATAAAFGTNEIFADATRPTGTVDSNTYYNATGNSYFAITGTGYINFASWKAATGYDAASTTTAGALPDTVVIIPNSQNTGQANVIIFAPSAPSTINVNLSTTGLVNGQTYTIKNAFDYNGTSVSTGTYSSGAPTISVNLASGQPVRNVSTPNGLGFTPATTAPSMAALMVVPGAAPSTVTTLLSGGVTFKNVIFQ